MDDPAKMKMLDTAIPLGRMAEPAEIASVVAFLAGDGGAYINGTTVFVDGGLMHSSPGSVATGPGRTQAPEKPTERQNSPDLVLPDPGCSPCS